jgi:hypothetical protein
MGAFDDLIPNQQQSNAFADLIPKEKEPFTFGPSEAMAGLAPTASSRAKLQEMNGQITPEQAKEQRQAANQLNQSAIQGATLGTGDEVQAAILSLVGTALPESMGGLPDGKSLVDNYKGIRDEIRERNNEFAEENPVIDGALKVAGGAATGGLGLQKAVTSQAGKAGFSKVLAASAAGGAEGAAAGFGFSDDTGTELAKDTAVGAAVGAAVPFLIGTAGTKISEKLAQSAARNSYLNEVAEATPEAKILKSIQEGAKKFGEKAPLIKQAQSQGFEDIVLANILGSNSATKKRMAQMVTTLHKAKTSAKYALRNRPANIVGEEAADRYKYVFKANKDAGADIDRLARDVLKGESIDSESLVQGFRDSMRAQGVKVGDDGLDFAGSEFSDFAQSKTLLNRVANQLHKVDDAQSAHNLKRFIDRQVVYGKRNQKAADPIAESLVKDFRRAIDDVLDSRFPEYDAANIKYKDTIEALDGVNTLLSKNSDVASDNFERSLGTLSRRLSSNAISGGRVDDALSEVSRIAEKYGGEFDVDFDSTVVFMNELERRFGSSAPTSFQGQIENAIQAAQRGNLKDAVIDKSIDLAKTASGNKVTDDNALASIHRLLTK